MQISPLAKKMVSLSLPSINAPQDLDVAHIEQQNYLNGQLQITTEEAQKKKFEEEEVLTCLREMRERVEGKEQSVRQLDQERRDAEDTALAEDAVRKTKEKKKEAVLAVTKALVSSLITGFVTRHFANAV